MSIMDVPRVPGGGDPDYPNIKLDYPLRLILGEQMFRCEAGCEFFMDEHGFQWVKFVPANGPYSGQEHMIKWGDTYVVIRQQPRQRGF